MTVKVFDYLPEDAKSVRVNVFIHEQGFLFDYDSTDDVATHIVIYCGKEPVCACRIFTCDIPGTYILGRLCVLKEYRSRGIGTRMLEEAEKCVKSRGCNAIILHSQSHAKFFYEKAGYEEYGEVEFEQGQPHIWMKKIF